MHSRSRIFPSDQLFELSKLMDIRQLFAYRILLLKHRKNISLIPIMHTYDTRHKRETRVKTAKANKRIGQRSPRFILNRLYGRLPDTVKDLNSFPKYRKSVRSWILASKRKFVHNLIDMAN